jgi:hypothetical protein
MANYATMDEADTYFSTRLNTTFWDAATDSDKTKALTMATRAIDRLSFVGWKVDDSQVNEWPRYDTLNGLQIGGIIPDDILIACCEIALSLLEGKTIEMEIEGFSITSQKLASASTTYDRTGSADYLRNLIVSPIAWSHLAPFISVELNLSRA